MNVATYAFLVSQGFTTEEIEKMENSITDTSTNSDGGAEDHVGTGTEDEGGEVEVNAEISELTKTVKELSDTVKAMQETNSKNAKGGKAEKKTSESVLKDFFTQV